MASPPFKPLPPANILSLASVILTDRILSFPGLLKQEEEATSKTTIELSRHSIKVVYIEF